MLRVRLAAARPANAFALGHYVQRTGQLVLYQLSTPAPGATRFSQHLCKLAEAGATILRHLAQRPTQPRHRHRTAFHAAAPLHSFLPGGIPFDQVLRAEDRRDCAADRRFYGNAFGMSVDKNKLIHFCSRVFEKMFTAEANPHTTADGAFTHEWPIAGRDAAFKILVRACDGLMF